MNYRPKFITSPPNTIQSNIIEVNHILTESLSDQVNTANCLAIVEKTGQSPLGCFPNAPVTPVTNVQ